MGAIRGVLLVMVSVLLFLALLIGNTFLTLTLSLDYDHVKTELNSTIGSVSMDGTNLEQVMKKKYPAMESYCKDNSEYVFKDDNSGYTFSTPCHIVAQGSEAVINYGANSFVEKIYYEDYDCEFWDCFKKTGSPLFLISEKARNYWNSKFYFALIASAVLITLVFFLVEKKSNLFIVAGGLLIISALPFMKLDWALSFISDKSFLELLTVFFSKAYTVFLIALISGIIILSTGILLKLFGIGFNISNLLSRFQKKDVKKEKKFSKNEAQQIMKKEIPKKIKDKKSK